MPFEKYIPNPQTITKFFDKVISGQINDSPEGVLPLENKIAKTTNEPPTQANNNITFQSLPTQSVKDIASYKMTAQKQRGIRRRAPARARTQKRKRGRPTAAKRKRTRTVNRKKRNTSKRPIIKRRKRRLEKNIRLAKL